MENTRIYLNTWGAYNNGSIGYGWMTAAEAIEQKDRFVFYSDIDEYHNSCDELLDFSGCNEILERYFDFDAYHRDCDFDIAEMSNGVCIAA